MAGSFLTDILQLGVNEIKQDGLIVKVKTDLGPAITVYDINDEQKGGSFIKGGVRIVNNRGKVIHSFGDWPKTNYLKAGLLFGGLFMVGAGVVYGVRKL